ncbi:zinc-binding metallopeptidase family protein [Azohydromonas lata]|uniref:Zinc-binding metallopeptidase n=1 Tax=Azohydromonas lata TaxID=45677 RepID=A0ABU5ICH7_9BURK|nr:putative zinc-binding metallopeptidase [Azohydromonas lata]MDZ5456820.1 putative zinc-binding metallopeptidase [Azohydromonas lata]
MERAKRRLVSQLIGLGLPVVSKVRDDPARGLAFEFPSPSPGGSRALTGHGNGVITINLDEADDPVREQTRQEMGEPYRTLLGHFRHEVGHYYWDRLVAGTQWLVPCRALFGDERLSYGLALMKHYEQGPPPDWRTTFVSSYASMHPWEDWAETWAHYLHVRDTLDTALSHGIRAQAQCVQARPFGREDLWTPADPAGDAFLDMLHAWIEITAVMNEMSAAMGHQDYYPFVLPRAAVAKLHFIHCVVSQARQEDPASDPPAVMAAAASTSARTPRRRASGLKAGEGTHGAH